MTNKTRERQNLPRLPPPLREQERTLPLQEPKPQRWDWKSKLASSSSLQNTQKTPKTKNKTDRRDEKAALQTEKKICAQPKKTLKTCPRCVSVIWRKAASMQDNEDKKM
jgi:hypothetical protein